MGRPSLREEIKTAYRKLAGAGEVDFDAPKKSLYQPIRKVISDGKPPVAEELNTVPKGLGDEAIRRAIAPLFNADKAKAKAKAKAGQ